LLKERIIIGKNGERFVLTAAWLSTVGRYIGYTIIPLALCDRSFYWRKTFAGSLFSVSLRLRRKM